MPETVENVDKKWTNIAASLLCKVINDLYIFDITGGEP